VHQVLASIKDEALQCVVVEESTGARFELAPKSRAFAPIEILTNICMAEHVRHDAEELMA